MTQQHGAASARRTECLVERLGHRGDGIADGPIYVDRALPSEHGDLRCMIDLKKRVTVAKSIS